MRLLLIQDDASRSAHILQRVGSWRPDSEMLLRSTQEGPLPPELLAQGFDAVLLTHSAHGQALHWAWARELASRPGFAPVVLVVEPQLAGSMMEQASHLGVMVLEQAEIESERLFEVLAAAERRQSQARLEWRGAAGRAQQSFEGVFIRGYRHIRRIAAGRMADLYLAESERAGRLVALKVARDEQHDRPELRGDPFRRFLQEYEIVQRVAGPSVVRLYDLGVSDEHAWLVMEYFRCGDLRTRIRAGIDIREALRLSALLARALEEIHAAGVLHRDLKPGNVMLREDSSIALIDFGLSKDVAISMEVTDEGAIFGTPHYMSPEQGHGEPIDARSDLYSLGVILFEMVSGEKPYRADNPMAIIYKHRKEPVPRLPGELIALQPLIECFLAKSPADRFQDASQAAAALERQLARYDAWYTPAVAPELNFRA